MKPSFFSRYEWWYHLAMMPVFVVAGNLFFTGLSYFSDLRIFLPATALILALYWITVVTLTMAVRRMIARFPGVDQTSRRLAATLLLVGALTTALAIFTVWLYSLMPGLAVAFNLMTVGPVIAAGLVFDVFLCAVMALFHSLEQWRKNEAENEKLERIALENQFDALKGQVNPHFLFNSLNTLSSLISVAPDEAEHFVEDLARIYRYMLQAAKTELIPLHTELEFLKVYTRLMKVRYQEGLHVIQPETVSQELMLPPLTLQILLDNAIQYNVLSASRPLAIRIELTENRALLVRNDIQARHRTLNATNVGLRGLAARYLKLTARTVLVDQSESEFCVTVPLLPE
nr:sensor histidine kinase [uncultured Dyadobacter sp.]